MGAIIALATQVTTLIPQLVALGIEVWPLINGVRRVLDENRAPDDAEWAALDAKVSSLQSEFRAAAKE